MEANEAPVQGAVAGIAMGLMAEGENYKILSDIQGLEDHDGDELRDDGVYREGRLVATIEDICSSGPVEHHVRFRHPETFPPDENGQGDVHAGFVVAAHRAVVDVDPELGLVKVVQIATAQDVGRALNPLSVLGQIEGGIAQGLGLVVTAEIIQIDGVIRNGNFTDYLLPTFLDMPDVVATLIEEPDPHAPLGAKGVGEPPCISATPAVVAAIRDALRQVDGVGKPLDRVPVRPADICL